MSKARNLADLLDANGDVALDNLDNVPPSNDASALTTGTLPIDRIADGAIGNAKIASGVDASKLTTGTIPAARIADGSIAAGKLDTVYQTPLTAGTDYLAPNGDGSGLTGLSSSSSKITVELESGTSLTAGGAVSLSSNGKAGNYPTLNSLGNEIPNTALDYNVECPDGETRVRYVLNLPGSSQMVIYGQYRNMSTYEVTESSTSFTVTADSGSGGVSGYGAAVYALGENYYFGVVTSRRDQGGTYDKGDAHGFVFKVNPSTGVPTKLGEVAHYANTGQSFASVGGGVISKDHFYLLVMRHTGTPRYYKELRFDRSTETLTSASIGESTWSVHSTDEQYHWLPFYKHRTSDNSKLLRVNGNTLYTQGLTSSGSAISHGTETSSTLRTDYQSDGKANFHPSSPYMMYYYYSSTGYYNLVLYSISSNGTLTEEDIYTTADNIWDGSIILYGSSYKEFILRSAGGWTTGLIDENNDFVGFNVPSTYFGIMDYVTKIDDSTFLVRGNGTNGQFYREYTVNAFETSPFDYMGLSNQTVSTGSAELTIAGVKDGYTGLTIGANYYVSDAYDGSINTDSTKGTPKVGKAISSTEILMSEIL